MNSTGDEDLLRSFGAGEKAALGVLYERYVRMVKGAVYRFVPEATPVEQDELVQEIFLAVGKSARRFPKEATFASWLYSIVVNKARKWRRNTWVRRKLFNERKDQPLGMALPRRDCPEEKAMLRQELAKALDTLSSKQREVMLLHAAEGFRGEEIAKILGISPATVRTRLYRAREKMLANVEKRVLREAGKLGNS